MVRSILFLFPAVLTSLIPVCGSINECNKLSFLVYKGADQIGKLHIIQLIEPNRITYTLTSDVSIDLIVEFNIEETIKDVFEKGHLQSSVHTRYVNGTLKEKNTLDKVDNGYKLMDRDGSEKHLKQVIKGSVLSLYFVEPIFDRLVYSENFQQLVELQKTASHTYSVKLPNGSVTTYSYKDSKMDSVVSQTRFGVIKFLCQK